MTVTPDQTDSSLLQEFAANRSQDAFTELVSRHSNWVYSAALRMVRDHSLAEDVAQAVFLVLADKAGKLNAIPLHRWLFKVTRYASANAIRARARRDKYERRAAMATSEIHEPDPDQLWQDIAPMLDDSMSRLRSKDRDALLMRFYQQKSVAEVGAALGVSEGAAKIRILRAIEKLRTILRRRGLAVPSDALGAALLTHTTIAAPATVAKGFALSTASVKATAISKGVSAMAISAKIKITAALILIACIPIGAGAYYLMGSDDRPAPPQPQAIAPMASAPEAVEIAAADSGLDPRIAPFVTDRADLIIAVDVDKIDLDALVTELLAHVSRTIPDQAVAGPVKGMAQGILTGGKQWIKGFTRAGGSSVFIIGRADQLIVSPDSGNMHFQHATIVFPTDSPTSAATLARYLQSPGSQFPTIDGGAVVFNPPAPEPSVSAGNQPDSRSSLAAALAAASGSPIRAALNPLKLKKIVPILTSMARIPHDFNSHEWDDVQWCNMTLVLPPAQSPGLVITSHYKDAATAAAARDTTAKRMAEYMKTPPDTTKPLAMEIRKFVTTEKFTASDSDMVSTLDLDAYWDLIIAAIHNQANSAATRPQRMHQ